MENIKLNNNSSWDDFTKAFHIVGLQAEIARHVKLCKESNFTPADIDSQLTFMYGKEYQDILKVRIIV